ncbi:cellulase-like family protein [Paenibacillus roseipurpureus]|uniref:Cellulase-like family protein n=1 Tax=Paenibacillus roseopurpureus TaxID=2918901 RepID=A0AA96LWS9_9BACL|nr:cellulase-like family protein [Paenibacillus sp. MBLB1832]WNR46105.1 cellulase-like family protein [Paenibacillus sp. MBLB1832]
MKFHYDKPLAITMWDFSWLERRWPGAGYEDWDQVLDELKERGYDAVRIDAYPHLIDADPEKEWTLIPRWNQQVWGAASLTRVSHIARNLIAFMQICKRKGIAVGLSTWFRQDEDDTRMKLKTPADLARIWKSTLDVVEEAGLMDIVLFVDPVNEYPAKPWTPFLYAAAGTDTLTRDSAISVQWMKESLAILRTSYPDLNYTFSDYEYAGIEERETDFLDFMEPHIWLASFTDWDQQVGYSYEAFESTGYDNLALNAEKIYYGQKEYWDSKIVEGIDRIADWAIKAEKALITTECWGVVDWKDWPLLDWKMIKEMCEIGTRRAASKGIWVAISTSNFCGPQFVGMWRDVEWHKQLTDVIHAGKLPTAFLNKT